MEPVNRALFTVNQFVSLHPWVTRGGLRSQIFHGATNGLSRSGAIIRSGKKILIDAERYIQWLEVTSGSDSGAAK